jgi:hypothetical protein
MDSLTSFLLSEHGEMSLDAFTDNMLANLPHQREEFDAFAPIIPFSSELIKNSGLPGSHCDYAGCFQLPGTTLQSIHIVRLGHVFSEAYMSPPSWKPTLSAE